MNEIMDAKNSPNWFRVLSERNNPKEGASSMWIVDTKGGYGKDAFEISILRENNEHGKRSYGWFDDNKLLVSHSGGPCKWGVTKQVWDGLIALAYKEADRLNSDDDKAKQKEVKE